MNPYIKYSEYLNTYGELEGKRKFLELCEVMEERELFPKCLRWSQIKYEIKNELI